MTSIMEIMQLCRFCLVKDQVNIPIFEEQGDIRQIFLKLTACLPVKVSKDDNLPKKICDGCLYKLELLYQFWNTTANAEKQLLTWLSQASMEAEAKAAQEVVTVVQQSQAHSVKQEAVEPVESTNENSDDLSTEAQNYILQQQQLPYEPETFTYQQPEFNEAQGASDAAEEAPSEELEEPSPKRRRRQSVKKVVEPDEPDEDDDDISQEMAITKTEEESDTEEETKIEGSEPTNFGSMGDSGDNEQPGPSGMGKVNTEAPSNDGDGIATMLGRMSSPYHIKIKLDMDDLDENKIAEANKDDDFDDETLSSRLKRLRERNKRRKKPSEAIKCDICEKTFKNNLAFGLHTISHNNNRKYSCHVCKYTSASRYHFEMHMRVHEGSTKYKCKICDKAFAVSTHADEHKYFHSGEMPFGCEICGKHFSFSRFLSSHKRSQHWEIMTGKPLVKYDCQICNKHYTSSTGLKRHKISKHNDGSVETSLLCDVCGKRLASKEILKFHRRIHTGYKPHVCNICTKSFTRKEQLKEHERVHTGEKPFICKYCGKGFTQRSPLRIHERTHTGEKPYTCRLCNKGYISKGIMDTHMKNCQGLPFE